ncbi:universal stress protein [Amycolatopsis echigonensis]|uniref:Universal stress protein n=1 Tax=Amycolatopsis echigonensis TaxID=2576905 RepID=A0A8E1W6R6_9PSEU|nr:universal stress protein [Amycolatopsis echigonensis]
MPGPIVVAFDGTSAAEHALAWAAAAAVRRGSDLVVATTTWWPVMLEPVPTGVPLVPDACVDLAAERVTAQWPDLRVSGIESGGVGELLARAAELDASLLVLAADIRVPWRALTRGADRTLAFVGTVAGPGSAGGALPSAVPRRAGARLRPRPRDRDRPAPPAHRLAPHSPSRSHRFRGVRTGRLAGHLPERRSHLSAHHRPARAGAEAQRPHGKRAAARSVRNR